MCHNGLVRSIGTFIMSPTKSCSAARPPGAGRATWCRWFSRANRGSSSHCGPTRGSPSPTRWRNRRYGSTQRVWMSLATRSQSSGSSNQETALMTKRFVGRSMCSQAASTADIRSRPLMTASSTYRPPATATATQTGRPGQVCRTLPRSDGGGGHAGAAGAAGADRRVRAGVDVASRPAPTPAARPSTAAALPSASIGHRSRAPLGLDTIIEALRCLVVVAGMSAEQAAEAPAGALNRDIGRGRPAVPGREWERLQVDQTVEGALHYGGHQEVAGLSLLPGVQDGVDPVDRRRQEVGDRDEVGLVVVPDTVHGQRLGCRPAPDLVAVLPQPGAVSYT